MKEELPRVLLVGISSWNKHEGTDTLQSIFSCWQKDKISQICTRSGNPCSDVCDNFFRISENQLIKSVFNRRPVGERVQNNVSNSKNDDYLAESKRYEKAHKKKSWLMSFARELVWAFGKWKTDNLDEFIKAVDPEVLFIPIYPVIYMARLQEHIIKKTKKPYVCYLADDNYTYKSCGKNPLELLYRFFLRKHVRKLSENCSQMYTITQIEGDETDKLFGTKSVVLAKSIDFSNFEHKENDVNQPISVVYTGNLLIGRDKTVRDVANAIREVNKNGKKIVLHIYSHTMPQEKLLEQIVSEDVVYHGKVDKAEVQRIQNEADVLLFVESLEKKDRYKARMSFSTKLVDYFAAGKCIFAIGDKEIAPIMYLKDNDAAIVASSKQEISEQLNLLANNKDLIKAYSKKSYECGRRNHDKREIDERFMRTMIMATGKEVR